MTHNPQSHPGNKHAAKPDSAKLSGDRFYVTAQKGMKARCVKAAQADGIKLNEWCRRAFNEKLNK